MSQTTCRYKSPNCLDSAMIIPLICTMSISAH
uniref:Uncharacterized protein n=1 Tax=Rhizophora mucronata TaxID=61149 RepID=A0A2P2J1D6_RHIMU